MHMPLTTIPASVWLFAFWPVAVAAAVVVAGLAGAVLRRYVNRHPSALPMGLPEPELASPAVIPIARPVPAEITLDINTGDIVVMTGEIATIPEGGPNDSLAA
ncbi:MAG: hypothetical protein KDA24_03185 [Deltaproteobacteria bacterium]|nr:hypothetical protein [Deltaproteobacteria bacterium]